MGVVVLKKNKDHTVQLYHYQDYEDSTATNYTIDLLKGDYIIVPRTIGLTITQPQLPTTNNLLQ